LPLQLNYKNKIYLIAFYKTTNYYYYINNKKGNIMNTNAHSNENPYINEHCYLNTIDFNNALTSYNKLLIEKAKSMPYWDIEAYESLLENKKERHVKNFTGVTKNTAITKNTDIIMNESPPEDMPIKASLQKKLHSTNNLREKILLQNIMQNND